MSQRIDPGEFGLPARTIIEEDPDEVLTLVIERRSRLIMADGRKIAAKAAAIRRQRPGCRLCLQVAAPVCSKTLSYLAEQGIEITRR